MKVNIQEIEEFIKMYFELYLKERSFEKLKPLFSEHITVVGTGMHEVGYNYEECLALYKNDISELSDPLAYKNLEIHSKLVSESQAVVFVSLDIFQDLPIGVMSIPNVRGTFNLIRSQEKWQILSVHMSVPFTEQNEGESFPLQKMKQQYSKLENMVEERTAELKRVNDQLRASNAAKDKFFSIIAHDLKSPFNSLLGFTELLTEDFDDFDEEDKKSILQAMHKSTGRIYNLTENLLVWARSQLKSVRFNPGVIELHNLVRDCQDHVHEMADKKQILIHNHVENGIKVFGDQYMLSTVMRNLLSNALKFTPENGKVRVCAEIQKSLSNESIKVMVDDTGIGIPESEIQEVFTVGKSVSKPGTNNEKGTGLGLAICKDFISFHKSDIHAENLPEKGSRFWFLLQPAE